MSDLMKWDAAPRWFFCSHRLFKPLRIQMEEGETVRQYRKRADETYSNLVNQYETPANGNRVYMNREGFHEIPKY